MNTKHLLICCLILFSMGVLSAEPIQQTKFKREWKFPCHQGIVGIELTYWNNPKEGGTLDIWCSDYQVNPSLKDEVGFLDAVTRDMEKMGQSPRKLSIIFSQIYEPEVRNQLAQSAYQSTRWEKNRIDHPSVEMVKILRANNAYEAFNQIFKRYGLKTVVAGVEKISEVMPSEMGLPPKKGLRVPVDASLEIALVPDK